MLKLPNVTPGQKKQEGSVQHCSPTLLLDWIFYWPGRYIPLSGNCLASIGFSLIIFPLFLQVQKCIECFMHVHIYFGCCIFQNSLLFSALVKIKLVTGVSWTLLLLCFFYFHFHSTIKTFHLLPPHSVTSYYTFSIHCNHYSIIKYLLQNLTTTLHIY